MKTSSGPSSVASMRAHGQAYAHLLHRQADHAAHQARAFLQVDQHHRVVAVRPAHYGHRIHLAQARGRDPLQILRSAIRAAQARIEMVFATAVCSAVSRSALGQRAEVALVAGLCRGRLRRCRCRSWAHSSDLTPVSKRRAATWPLRRRRSRVSAPDPSRPAARCTADAGARPSRARA